jgi:hypothetical protein
MNERERLPLFSKQISPELCCMTFDNSSRARATSTYMTATLNAVRNELSTAQRVRPAASLRPEEKQDLDCARFRPREITLFMLKNEAGK